MPIKPENKGRYPKDWAKIRDAVLKRAGNRCEGSPQYEWCRAVNGEEHPVTRSLVVLTIAHLDHTPENCSMDNLKAMCQRCHLTYDAKYHAEERKRARRVAKENNGQMRLF